MNAIWREAKADHHGAAIAVDVVSGVWAIGDIALAVADSPRMPRFVAVDVSVPRVGDRTPHHCAGRPLKSACCSVLFES